MSFLTVPLQYFSIVMHHNEINFCRIRQNVIKYVTDNLIYFRIDIFKGINYHEMSHKRKQIKYIS